MVRILGFLVGLGFVGVLLISLVINGIAAINEPAAETAEHKFYKYPKEVSFSSDGPFGKYDRQQLQRGYQVYKEVCAVCHGINYVAIRNLEDLGYNDAEIKAEAANWQIADLDPETGDDITRPGIPADRFPPAYRNEVARAAAGSPPDLSLITKAREGGAPYIYSLLTGYQEPSAEMLAEHPEIAPGPGLYFNPYFKNLNISMPPPITADGQVSYADGTEATVEQMSKDVSAFLVWTAEPKLEQRHRAGWATLIFILFATIFAYFAYRNVWAEAKRKVAPKGVLDPEHQAKVDHAEAEAAEDGRPVDG
ncbi:cytochrome c1 [Sphingomicrobium clamense]|uniref:Cytochrome c1 n=1 Tax=Sphingomicrobium clamense TaxID=2851013 RepID=A0ABS6V5H2_9SPHN|nr:cytochrome c1 [Sphingomicrobium sp. B8]MBW0144810.1 cytochrome c1 [Sphingomicrobium sp. B8]